MLRKMFILIANFEKIHSMTFDEYFQQFDEILTGKITRSPYDSPEFMEYVKLNFSRLKRWLKTGDLLPELEFKIKQISEKQTWVLITEHWCGDAAHILPFLELLSKTNNNIELKIQLRDENSEIDSYLTNETKSIPILIIRNNKGEDLFVWGPRPKAAQDYFIELKISDLTKVEQKMELQNWYNNDKGKSLQFELLDYYKK
jgi:hypothetical protein